MVIHRTTHLHPTDRRHCKGLPLTSPARTLLDVAPRLTPRQLERALDEALVRRITTLTQVRSLLARANGRHHAARLKSLVADRGRPTTITRSPPEEQLLDLIRKAGLPQPQLNAHISGYEVDFYWPRQRLVVEIDSYTYHSSRSAFERDKRKDAALRSSNLKPLRFSPRQLRDEPLLVIAQIAQAAT